MKKIIIIFTLVLCSCNKTTNKECMELKKKYDEKKAKYEAALQNYQISPTLSADQAKANSIKEYNEAKDAYEYNPDCQ